MTAPTHFIEIIFENHIAPGDLEIITEATYDQPGQARLAQARVVESLPGAPVGSLRVLSCNGGGFIGIIAAADSLMPPYNFSYWLLPIIPVTPPSPRGGGAGGEGTKELAR